MIKYIHGSEDSLDIDVLYVFPEMPSFRECQVFCSNTEENRNIIIVKDNIVVDCFKGTADEINNGLLSTYKLHKQDYENIVKRKVERDILIKIVRVVRCLLSHCSRTKYRSIVKSALKSHSWTTKIETLNQIDFSTINDFGKNNSQEDVYKIFAFQLGQVLGLMENKEFYTKSSISNYFNELRPYLYREKNSNLNSLINFINIFIEKISKLNVEENGDVTLFNDFSKKINLKAECYVE